MADVSRDLRFNGNGHTFDGQGKTYWDTFGSNKGGSQKAGPVSFLAASRF